MSFLKSQILPITTLFLISLITISIWFKDGKLLATGEEGLILANPARSIELYQHTFSEIGPGIAAPGLNPWVPYLTLESYLIEHGLLVWQVQAATFLLLMFTGSVFSYQLTCFFLRDQVNKRSEALVGLLAAIFYLFNPISMLGVWYRFALSFMFFYALAPMFLYLFIVGLNKRDIWMVILLPLMTLPFSFVYSAPSTALLLWLLPFIYTIVSSRARIKNGSVRYSLYPSVYFSLMLFFWFLISLWWIIPFIELSKSAFASETGIEHAVGTLTANSKYYTLDNVIRLIHSGFLYTNEAFGSIYSTFIPTVLSWLIPVVTILGVIKLKSGSIKVFLLISLILLLFLVKGTSFPFGFIYLWLFKISTVFQLYRNPLEKIGMLLPIIYAPLFAYGIYYFIGKVKSVSIRVSLIFTVIFLILLLHWPFFTGAMVVFGGRDIRVEVPISFKHANNSIKGDDHRLLSIPMMGGVSGFYKWPSGYKGVDGSEYLFDSPVIVKAYDAKSFYGQLLIAESNGKVDNNLTEMAQLFSADLIVFRKDIDVPAFRYNFNALERAEKMIQQSNLTMLFDSEEVSIWSLPEDKIVPLVYAPKAARLGESPDELVSLVVSNQYDPKSEVFICTNSDKCNPYNKIQDLSLLSIKIPPDKIETKKISPGQYDIKIIGSTGKFILVFNNTYHSGWAAVLEGQKLSPSNHFVANGYANGFVIDKTGDFEISLQFEPEKNLIRGTEISGFAAGIGLVILIILLLKRGAGWKKSGR